MCVWVLKERGELGKCDGFPRAYEGRLHLLQECRLFYLQMRMYIIRTLDRMLR